MQEGHPTYPIKVFFYEDNEEWIFDNEIELASTLEFFDSEDPKCNAKVTDSFGRNLTVKVDKLELQIIKFKP